LIHAYRLIDPVAILKTTKNIILSENWFLAEEREKTSEMSNSDL